jgi:hypothetical protein
MALDLTDAVLQRLRGSPCAAMFGDTWNPAAQSGVQKFFSDYNPGLDEPYLVLREPQETRQYMTASEGDYRPFIATGTLQVSIYAPDRTQARELGEQVRFYLDDAPLTWNRCVNLMYFRLNPAAFVPTPTTGPDTPSVFHRILVFEYTFQGAL